jgi:hypothetical protein
VMMRDGVMAAGSRGDPAVAGETFLNGVEGMLQVFSVDGVFQLHPPPTGQPSRGTRRR